MGCPVELVWVITVVGVDKVEGVDLVEEVEEAVVIMVVRGVGEVVDEVEEDVGSRRTKLWPQRGRRIQQNSCISINHVSSHSPPLGLGRGSNRKHHKAIMLAGCDCILPSDDSRFGSTDGLHTAQQLLVQGVRIPIEHS